jgi:hypothetical protein
MSKNDLSRRTLITGAASLPVAATAISVPAIATAIDNPDAELLALGPQLDAIIRQHVDKEAHDAAFRAARKARCEAAGLPEIKFGDVSSYEFDAHLAKCNAVCADIIDEDDDETGADIVWAKISDRTFSLASQALLKTAVTAEGLGLQARIVSLCENGLWSWNREDSQLRRFREFVEVVCRFSGVTPVPLLELQEPGSVGASVVVAEEESDPIFAAIEQYRVAYDAHGAALNAEYAATSEASRARADRLSAQACDAAADAACNMCRTVPTTAAGVVALLDYVEEAEDGNLTRIIADDDEHRECGDLLLTTLRVALTPLAAKGGSLV